MMQFGMVWIMLEKNAKTLIKQPTSVTSFMCLLMALQCFAIMSNTTDKITQTIFENNAMSIVAFEHFLFCI